MPIRLLIIRHAESEANAEGRIQGHLDIPLSALGARQSALLAARLASSDVHALYSSPLLRAHQTAAVVAERLGLPLTTVTELRERDVGVLEGLNRKEILARFPQYAQPGVDPRNIAVEGFEQDGPLTTRITSALRHILAGHQDKTIAVVTHGGVIGTALRWLLNMPRIRPGPFIIENASITTIDIRAVQPDGSPVDAQLTVLNDTCHLQGSLAD